MHLEPPPCPNCGQPMTDRNIGNKDEYQCRPCQFALSPLADMCLEDGLLPTWVITNRDYKELPYLKELDKWLKRVNADYPGPRLKHPSFMNATESSAGEPEPQGTPVRRSVQPLSPEIRAWKDAHVLMWQRWQEFIDFQALKKRHVELPVEWRYDALFDAIGMLYGEYLTDHINEYRELEAQILEKYKSELR